MLSGVHLIDGSHIVYGEHTRSRSANIEVAQYLRSIDIT
jgi:hypothetical protein